MGRNRILSNNLNKDTNTYIQNKKANTLINYANKNYNNQFLFKKNNNYRVKNLNTIVQYKNYDMLYNLVRGSTNESSKQQCVKDIENINKDLDNLDIIDYDEYKFMTLTDSQPEFNQIECESKDCKIQCVDKKSGY